MEWTTALPDWADRIIRGDSLCPVPALFPSEAEAAANVFDGLVLVDVAGEPLLGDLCRPWIREFRDAVFGAYDPETGRRLIRQFMLLVAKKNSKSSIAAGIMLTALIRNWRKGAEFLILAPTVEIANNSFGPASAMVRADPELTAMLHVADHHRTITHLTMGATLRVIAADNEAVSGKKATGIFVDELWLFGKRANAGNMLLEATGGLAARPEGFVIFASTQSDEPPVGVFKEKVSYFRDVRDGKVNDPLSLGILYEYPPEMLKAQAFRDPSTWYIGNPNMGASVDRAFLDWKFSEAERAGDAALRQFFAKHLNVEIGLGLRSDAWSGAEHWAACVDRGITFDALLERCEVITASIDGGGMDDLMGLCLLGRERGTGRWLAWFRAWAHRIALDRRKSEMSRLLDFEKDGDLVVVDEVGTHVGQAADIVEQVHKAGLLGGVGLDSYDIKAIAAALAARDVSGEAVFGDQKADLVQGIPQGWRISGAIKETELQLAARTLLHAGRPMMSWCVSNAKVVPNGNAISITKAAAGTAKIDPLIALFNAVELMSRDPQPATGRSFWDTDETEEA